MSRNRFLTVECPKCGESQNVRVWLSINKSLNPELESELFADKLNKFSCSACDHQDFIDTPLIYHDMKLRYAVSYYPFHNIDDDGLFNRSTPDGRVRIDFSPKLSKWMGGENYLVDTHVVFEIEEMKRYIVFRNKLHKLAGSHD